jgi:hypothetical protein
MFITIIINFLEHADWLDPFGALNLTNESEERSEKSITRRRHMGSFFKLGTAWHLSWASTWHAWAWPK